MAILEFEFKATGLSGLTNNLNNLQNQLNNINRNSSININAGNSSRNLNAASDSILGLRSRLNELLRTYGSLSEAQRNNSRVQNNLVPEINRLREAVTQANREYDNLRRGSGRPIPSDSIVGMRTRLNELRAVYDRLSESQRNSGRVQSNLVGEINRLNTAVSRAEQATGRYQRNVGNYEKAQSGANGVAMEFNRIIQDAPFGMMGIGNNIQQLAANWQVYTQQAKAAAAANGTTVTSMGLMKGAMASMMSTGNLITLGIAAITSAWTFYTMQQQKANKASKDNRSEMDKLKDSLSNYNQVLAENEAKGQNEITRLNRLMSVYKDVNQSQRTRKGAYEDMISLYETYFGKLSKEERKTFDLAKAYDKLSVSILKTAKARAFDDLIEQNEKDIILLEKSLIDSGNKIIGATNKVGEQYRKNRVKSSEDASKQGVNPRNIYEIKQAEDALNKSAEEGNKIATRKNTLLRENESYEKKILALGLEGAKITDSTGDAGKEREKATANTTKNIKDQRDYLLEIQQILQNSQGRVDTGGDILDWDKELIKVHNYYDSQTIALDKMLVSSQRAYKDDSAKRLQIEQAVSSTRITLHNNMINELSKIDDKYFNQGKDLINELISAYGEQPIESALDKELKKNKLDFSKKREQAIELKVSQDDLDLLNKLERDTDKNIKVKFATQNLEEIDKLEKKIQDLVDKPFSSKNKDGLIKQTEERKKEVQELYDILVQVMKLGYDGQGTGGLKISEEDIKKTIDSLKLQIETNAKKQSDDKKLEKDIQDYTNILKTGVDNVFTNLKTNIDEFGWKAESVFYSLGETVGDMLKQVANKNTAKFMESITKDAKSFTDLKDNWKNMSSQDKWSAGLGFAGGAISGLTPQTSSGGQAIGGALSGAAAGASIGGAYGAAIGAVVGGVSGLLKAAKNKRQEKILIQQMEEQKKANRLLERLSALTYASQIIGQKTEYGIVSGVKRNEFGQIVSVVQGQDIIMVADRTNKQKQR